MANQVLLVKNYNAAKMLIIIDDHFYNEQTVVVLYVESKSWYVEKRVLDV